MADVGLTEEEIRALPALVSLTTAGRAFGMGRDKAARLHRSGEFPCPVLTIGNSRKVARAAIIAALGLADEPAPPATAEALPPTALGQPPGGYLILAIPVSADRLPELLAGPLAPYVKP